MVRIGVDVALYTNSRDPNFLGAMVPNLISLDDISEMLLFRCSVWKSYEAGAMDDGVYIDFQHFISPSLSPYHIHHTRLLYTFTKHIVKTHSSDKSDTSIRYTYQTRLSDASIRYHQQKRSSNTSGTLVPL